MKYKPKHILEYVLFRTVAGLVLMLPLRAALGLSWLLAAALHFIGRVHVARTRGRIRQVFGSTLPEKAVRRIAWLSWRNLCFSAVESIRFPKMTIEQVRKHPLGNLENTFKTILEHCESGYILATPHFGNWELAGIAGDLMGLPLFVIVRKQKNPLMNQYINKMRRSFNLEVLHRETKAWKSVTDRIKAGKVLAILPDISSRRGVTVDYLNRQATIAPGTARFAQITNCPIYPVFVKRIGWTKHEGILLDPIFPDSASDPEADQQRIMQEIMSAFSQEILRTPEQYFWYNKRWVLNSR